MFSLQDYVARFGHGSAKLARQAQSKEKVLAKMVAGGLTERVVADKVCGREGGRCLLIRSLHPDQHPKFPVCLCLSVPVGSRLCAVNPKCMFV